MSAGTTDYLEGAGFNRLWGAAREAWERNGGLAGSAVVHNLSETEAFEISGLLGRRRPLRAHATARVPLAELDEALRVFALPLHAWLERTGHRLVDRRQERVTAEAARAALWDEIGERACRIRPDLEGVVTDLRRTGLARRLAGEQERLLLKQSLDVLATILALDQNVDIAVLAAEVCGDAKALNGGNPVGTVVLRALALLGGTTTPADEEGRRRLWEQHLVLCNSVSSTVLTLNLTVAGNSTLARSLALSAEAREPRVVTLRELSAGPAQLDNTHLCVCENPTVVSAAVNVDMPNCVALVCVEGWPSVAAHRLLKMAQLSGTELLYHGDFDWHGLRIADSIVGQYGARPWRMEADDYITALEAGADTRPLSGEAHVASWSPELTSAMIERARVLEEEGSVLTRLLADLADAGSHRRTGWHPLTAVS